MAKALSAGDIIARLGLEPHPEGGHYRETWRARHAPGERAAGSAIYFLLREGEVSRWHRVDAAEIWHWYAGAPLKLEIAAPDGPRRTRLLGNDLAEEHEPQLIVPPHHWQSARSLGAWTLVGCTVSPGFEFSSFELAAPDWLPPG